MISNRDNVLHWIDRFQEELSRAPRSDRGGREREPVLETFSRAADRARQLHGQRRRRSATRAKRSRTVSLGDMLMGSAISGMMRKFMKRQEEILKRCRGARGEEALMAERIVKPARRLRGTIAVPGDKSISHRAAMLNALADGEATVHNFLAGEDCRSTLGVLRALGVESSSTRAAPRRCCGSDGVGLSGLREPADGAGLREFRHDDAADERHARGAAVPVGAQRRRIATHAADGPRRRTAARDGRADRRARGRAPGAAGDPRRWFARHPLPHAGGERAGEVEHPARGALRRGRDRRRGGGGDARPHGAHARRDGRAHWPRGSGRSADAGRTAATALHARAE